MARAKISGITQNRIVPTKETTPTDQGKTADEMVAETGVPLTGDAGVSSSDQQSAITPKSSVITGTTYPIPPRYVASNSQNLAASKKDGQFDPTFANRATLQMTSGSSSVGSIYYGPQLVDEKGNITGSTYSSQGEDIVTEFFGSSAAERATMIATAQKLNLFYGQKPSAAMLTGSGLDSGDRVAIQGLLDFSVRQGRTWKAVASMVSSGQIAASAAGGTGARYSVVSTENAMESVKQEFLTVLKRMPTPAEIRQAALNIQNEERKRAQGGSMDPTTLDVAARAQAVKAAPGEYAANAAGSAVNRLFALFGGA
jgi:hypothetical protein